MEDNFIKEKPLVLLPSLAKEVGVNHAVILQQLYYLTKGEKDCFLTYDLLYKEFEWLNPKTVNRLIHELEAKGYIITRRGREGRFYTIKCEDVKKPEKVKESVQETQIVIPDNLNNEKFLHAWSEWQQFRKEKRAKLTPSTAKKQLSMLSKLKDPIACIERSIQNGWIGLFPKEKTQEDIVSYQDLLLMLKEDSDIFNKYESIGNGKFKRKEI